MSFISSKLSITCKKILKNAHHKLQEPSAHISYNHWLYKDVKDKKKSANLYVLEAKVRKYLAFLLKKWLTFVFAF